ncbi:hypothetical protein [Burkholderia pyrrocinia]|uniref:hypothetical protein n=1 Tax=Burkholderia pyrrocinia TaxID=60550 RepID=UPI001BCBC9CE|nr:hypothetical protein [Burkholderia pyrrocinia]QVN23145.1 hypothetical protein JYG32_37610 [Burkholderia pyrrocinia]
MSERRPSGPDCTARAQGVAEPGASRLTLAVDWPPGADATARREAGPLRLYNLRLPFRLQMIARRGRHRLAGERRSGVLAQGDTVVVDRYRTVHYEGATAIDPRTGYELHLLIHDERPLAHRAQAGATPGVAACCPLAACVADAVFREPARAWSVARAAEHLQMNARRLQTLLFRESAALTAIVREQRLMRALLVLLAQSSARGDLAQLADQVGFASASCLDNAFDAHFGASASRIARLAWCPALTWSIAGTGGASGGPSGDAAAARFLMS